MHNIAGMKSKLIPVCLVLATVCALALAGCDSSGSSEGDGLTGGVAATVNGDEIAEDDVTTFIQNIRSTQGVTDDDAWAEYLNSSGYTPETLREYVIENMYVTQKLEEQAAADEGVEVTDEEVDENVEPMRANYDTDEEWEEALESAGYTDESYRELVRESLLEEKLEDAVVSDDDAKADDETVLYYVQMYAPSLDGMKRSSHILFESDDEETAQSVLDQLNNGADFAQMAQEYSTDTGSKDNGGDVGWEGLGSSFVTAYSDALAELDKGEMSGLVTSDYGIHIILCTDIWNAPETIDSLDDVPAELVEAVRTSIADPQAKQQAFSNYLQKLRDDADIEINDMPENVPYNVDMSAYLSTGSSTASGGAVALVESSSAAAEVESSSAAAEADSSEDADATAEEAEDSQSSSN